jgi:endonuclease YncB( thermonuclease family)
MLANQTTISTFAASVLLVIAAALCATTAVPASAAPKPVKARVVGVVDGDTVRVRVRPSLGTARSR